MAIVFGGGWEGVDFVGVGELELFASAVTDVAVSVQLLKGLGWMAYRPLSVLGVLKMGVATGRLKSGGNPTPKGRVLAC